LKKTLIYLQVLNVTVRSIASQHKPTRHSAKVCSYWYRYKYTVNTRRFSVWLSTRCKQLKVGPVLGWRRDYRGLQAPKYLRAPNFWDFRCRRMDLDVHSDIIMTTNVHARRP